MIRAVTILRRCGAMVLMSASALMLQAAPAARWSPINTGLPSTGVSINSLLVDPSTSSTLYAVATTETNGGGPGASIVPILFKSVDAGATWVAIGSVSGVTCLAIDPSNSSNLYAGTDQGVMKSSDGGQSWTDASNNLPNGSVTRLVIDPGTPSTLYAVASNASVATSTPSPPGLAAGNALYKTTDGGASWNPLNLGLSPNASIAFIVLAPGDPSTIYILAPAFNPSTPSLGVVGGLAKSSDGGQTWTPLNNPLTVPATSLAADQNVPHTLYIGYSQGMQKSTDGGQTWNPVNLTATPNSPVDVIATAPSAIYATVSSFLPSGLVVNLLESTDGGTTWNPLIFNPPLVSITAIAPDPQNPANLYISGAAVPPSGMIIPLGLLNTTVFKTADGGQTWNSTNAGLGAFDIRAVAVNPVNENAVFAGGSGGVSASTDGGVTWSSTALSAYTTLLIADPNLPGSLYALTGTSNGCDSDNALLFATTDAGVHWSSAVSPLNTGCILNAEFTPVGTSTSIAIAPTDSNTLYLAESDSMDGFSAILKTTNDGADWSILWDWFSGLTAPVLALSVDPTQSTGVYAGIDDTTASGGLFESADGGATWTNTGMTSSAVTLLAIDPGNPQVIYATAEGHSTTPAGFQGIFKSMDAGQTWAASSAGLSALIGARSNTATALLIDPADTQVLYLGTSTGGVYQSNDGGATWTSINDGLTSLAIRSLAVANGPSHAVYAATSGGAFKYSGSAVQ